MRYIQIAIAVLLSFVLSNTVLSTDNTIEENDVSVTDTPKQTKTMEDLRREALANSKPLPGSHYDENYRVIIDDPEVYQKALEKEQAQNNGKFDYQHPSTPPENYTGPFGIFYKVYKYNSILGVLFFIFVAFLAIVCLSIRDSFKKKK